MDYDRRNMAWDMFLVLIRNQTPRPLLTLMNDAYDVVDLFDGVTIERNEKEQTDVQADRK